jgi:hypothetical protein
MRFAWWIINATDTHSEYVILNAFPRQQWLRERASVLRYTYIACLLCYCIRQQKKAVTYFKFRRSNRGNALSVVSGRLVEACHNLYWNNDTLQCNRFFQTATLTLRLLMSCIYGVHILDVSRSHTTTHHSR